MKQKMRYILSTLLLMVTISMSAQEGLYIGDIFEHYGKRHVSLTVAALLPFAFYLSYGLTSIPFGMVYAAQTSFHRAKTFDFDNKTIETTSALEEARLLDAFVKVRDLRQKSSMIHGTSNMIRWKVSYSNGFL